MTDEEKQAASAKTSAFDKSSADKSEDKKKAVASQEELSSEELKEKLEECQKLKDEYLAGWQRSRADFLNYKKEEMERIGQLIDYAKEELILEILPIMDNFDVIARQNFLLENLSGQEKERVNKIIQGFLQIKIQFQDFLKNMGVEEIKSVGEKFDPNFHEVIEEVESKDRESGIIVEEIQKGYKINSRLLRPARVKVVK